jgi:O-antigen/teichoic acid export membrane protein
MTFFLTPYIVARIGSEAYGMAQLAMQMTNYVAIFTVALNSMAARFITIEINKNNQGQANIYFNSVLRANTVIALLLMLPSLLVSVYVDRIFNVPAEILGDVRLTFGFVFINVIIALLGNIFTVATFVKNKLYLASARNIEGNIIKLLLTLALFFLFAPRIWYITLAVIGMTLYTLITNIYYTKKLLPEVRVSTKVYSGKAIRTLISSGIWNALDQLSNVILGSLDLWIANILLGATLMGQYSLAKSIPMFIIMFIASVISVFAPQFTVLYARDEQAKLLDALNLAMKVMALIVVVPVAFLLVFGEAFFALWLPGEDARFLYGLSNLILIPVILTGSTQPLFNIFTVTNKLKLPAYATLAAGILNIVLTFILYYWTDMGIYAIPVASLAIRVLKGYSFTPIYAAWCLGEKWYRFYPAIVRNIILILLALAVCYGWKSVLSVDSWLGFGLAMVVCGFSVLVVDIFWMTGKGEREKIWRSIVERLHK